MMQWLDRLNLQPHEKRWLIVGLLIVAAVLNYWLVWPYFGEWSQLGTDRQKLDDSRNRYLSEIGKKAAYEKKLKDLQKAGARVERLDNQEDEGADAEAAPDIGPWTPPGGGAGPSRAN